MDSCMWTQKKNLQFYYVPNLQMYDVPKIPATTSFHRKGFLHQSANILRSQNSTDYLNSQEGISPSRIENEQSG